MLKKSLLALTPPLLLAAQTAWAGMDKIYDPYVEQGETEIEARGLHNLDNGDYETRLGIGYGVTSRWFVEGYLTGEREHGTFKVNEAELESKFQLTGQGQYWADFGLLAELEKKLDQDQWEFKAGPIIQKQFGRFVATTNLLLEKKFGNDTPNDDFGRREDKLAFLGAAQLKYRLQPTLEPAVQYYSDDGSQYAGPALTGSHRFGGRQKLKWELGLLFGVNDKAPDSQLRWQAEWEF